VKRIDVATAMITCEATVDALSKLDLGYAPPFATAMDPIITAANVVKNKLEGRVVGISPAAVKEKIDRSEEFILLDVRNYDEYAEGALPDAVLVPLHELKNRLGEIPKQKEIVVFCEVGIRAYLACLELQAHGYKNVKLMDGSITAWPYEIES